MEIGDSAHVVLLVLPVKKHIFPLSTAAFSVTQGAKKEILADYEDAFILDERGFVWRFDRIDFIGPYGNSPMQKLFSFLTKTKNLAVLWSASSFPLDQLKSTILRCILNGGDFVNEDADDAERGKLLLAVKSAPDTLALFRAFNMPSPKDALDQL